MCQRAYRPPIKRARRACVFRDWALGLIVLAPFGTPNPAKAACSPQLTNQSNISVVCTGIETNQQGDGANNGISLQVVSGASVLNQIIMNSNNRVDVFGTISSPFFSRGITFAGLAIANTVTIHPGGQIQNSNDGIFLGGNGATRNTLINFGSISNVANGIVLLNSRPGDTNTVINESSGTITVRSPQLGGRGAILGGAGSDIVLNYGKIIGDVYLPGAGSELRIFTGSSVIGKHLRNERNFRSV
jgi:hypothetical protein